MEKRDLKISFSKSGNGYDSTRLIIPINWIKDMGIDRDNRDVEVYYSEDKKEIIVRKKINV